MDKYRPKRPTTLALFPQLPQAGTQDSINNNSLGNKDSWKDPHSSSPHITGDLAPPDIQPKAEDKVLHSTCQPATRPPITNGARGNTATTTAAVLPLTRDRQVYGATHTHSSNTQRNNKQQGGGPRKGVGRGGGNGAKTMRERSLGDIRRKVGVSAGKEDRRGGRLCEDSKGKENERNGHQRPREANGLKNKGANGKGKEGAKGGNREGGFKPYNMLSNKEVYLTAMVVPRTPVAPRNQDKTQDQGQNHNRTQGNPPVLSQSCSEGGTIKMSLSSDTEGPPPGPMHPSLSLQNNPDIREEEGEGEWTPCMKSQSGPTRCVAGHEKIQMDCSKSEMDTGGEKGNYNSEAHCTAAVTQGDCAASQTVQQSEAKAGLNYEHARLELVSLKDCLHRYNDHNDDSDAETVYQSANEEEDPEYEEERKRRDQARKKEKRKEEEKRSKKDEEMKKRREEDVKMRREEEVKRRREVVARFCRQSKVTSTTTEEGTRKKDEFSGQMIGAIRSRKLPNLFANNRINFNATGAGSHGVFSCVLDGVERQQSHRAVYRFVPRHADELYLEMDDPVLMLKQSEDLWCQGYNMRTGATGIFPAFYAVGVAKDNNKAVQKDDWIQQFLVQFLGSVQVPVHKGNDVLCAAMQKVACNRRLAGEPPSACVMEVSVKGVKISVQDQCHSAQRGDQCSNFFQLKNISFCGCHPKHSKYFGFITKHPDQQRFACHVMMADGTLHPLAESVGRAFQQYYKENIGYSCPTEDIFIE